MVYAGGFFSITYMQEMTATICSSATTPAITATASDTIGDKQGNTAYVPEKTLIDSRDGKTYLVRKLADGNCWMVQNLDLDLSVTRTLTANDSDVSRNWTPSVSTLTSSIPASSTTSVTSWDPGNIYYVTNGTTRSTSGQLYEHAGNYYNWLAVSAGTNSTSTTSSDSICPKGWKMAMQTGDKSYTALFSKYGAVGSGSSMKTRSFPLSFVLAGYYGSHNNSTDCHDYVHCNAGKYQFLWIIGRHAISIALDNDNYINGNQNYESSGFYGWGVRCVNK